MYDSTIFLASRNVFLYLHHSSFSFLYAIWSWKHGMVFLAVWAFGFIRAIFHFVIWVFMPHLPCLWHLLQLSLWCLYFWHLMHLKGAGMLCSTLSKQYPIFTSLGIIGLLNVKMCLYFFTNVFKWLFFYNLWLLAFLRLFLFPLVLLSIWSIWSIVQIGPAF